MGPPSDSMSASQLMFLSVLLLVPALSSLSPCSQLCHCCYQALSSVTAENLPGARDWDRGQANVICNITPAPMLLVFLFF